MSEKIQKLKQTIADTEAKLVAAKAKLHDMVRQEFGLGANTIVVGPQGARGVVDEVIVGDEDRPSVVVRPLTKKGEPSKQRRRWGTHWHLQQAA